MANKEPDGLLEVLQACGELIGYLSRPELVNYLIDNKIMTNKLVIESLVHVLGVTCGRIVNTPKD